MLASLLLACSGGGGQPGAGGRDAASDAGPDAGAPGALVDYLRDPTFPDDFWRPATFAEAGMDPAPLEQAVARIAAARWEIHSFLVARNGRLVVERYGPSLGTLPGEPIAQPHQVLPSERHLLYSTTKSVLAALVGQAMAEDATLRLDERVAARFPDYDSLNPSAPKSAITFEDLLTMRSGLEFTEGDQTTFEAPDPARAMFSRPVVGTPGLTWNYSSGVSDIVAEILRLSTGATPLAYAKAKLFGPLGIVDPPWRAGATGTNHGGWGLALTSRELARFGELFRNRGAWAGQQIVPAAWTDTTTGAHCMSTWGMQYGYHWWVFNVPGFFGTIGAFGQQLFVNRELGLVIVFTANLPSEQASSIFEMLIREHVVPSVRAPG